MLWSEFNESVSDGCLPQKPLSACATRTALLAKEGTLFKAQPWALESRQAGEHRLRGCLPPGCLLWSEVACNGQEVGKQHQERLKEFAFCVRWGPTVPPLTTIVYPSIHMSIHTPNYLSIHSCTHPSAYLAHKPIYLCAHLLVYPCHPRPFICLPILPYIPVPLHVFLSTHASMLSCIWLF